MQDFEKLGAFYLGHQLDAATGSPLPQPVLYDSKDLTTHAAIIGMTGSGKTGLGIGLIEEAAMDHIPVIAIDPKGDLGNLLLTFPDFRPEDFAPWVDPHTAAEKGLTMDAFAAKQASAWQEGLARSGQSGERIRRLKANCDFVIYTPGSLSGNPIAILGELAAPGDAVRGDPDVYNDLIEGSVTGILGLIGIAEDPVTSREHILLSNILRNYWDRNQGLGLVGLIAALQAPPLTKIGVIDIDTFFPAKERFELAMRINNLLAAPGFEAWLQGDALDIDTLLYNAEGKPRVSVLSIAHLGDRERMFFVTMLLNALLAWMRRQTGSSALRAMLYIDEVFGYMPPTANPPSKKPLLTLLKQARAFGVGTVLSTQNPVDLDYKGMSNMGTWFIGRLQTERDKLRLLEGLQSVDAGRAADSQQLSELISSLGKRQFLLHNVHEDAPVLFATRWVMSYLAGPLSREQIKRLSPPPPVAPDSEVSAVTEAAPAVTADPAPEQSDVMQRQAPILEPSIKQCWLAPSRPPLADEGLRYEASLLAEATVTYTNARAKVDTTRRMALLLVPDPADTTLYWDDAHDLAEGDYRRQQQADGSASYATCPTNLCQAANYKVWERELLRWIRSDRPLRLLKSSAQKLISEPGESERDFRIRLQQLGNEQRDLKAAKLRQDYANKLARLEDRLMSAEQAVDRESEQASSSKVDTALSVGTALLGALLGRKRVSTTTVTRAGTAARRASNMRKQMGDVKRAEAKVAAVLADIEALKARCEEEVLALDSAYDAQQEELEEILVRARSTQIRIDWFGIAWQPVLTTG